MKKCRGCGVELQYIDKDKKGYAVNESFDYCQRCFRLMHYGDISKIDKNIVSNKEIINNYQKINDALFVLIVDPFDALFFKEDNFFKDKDVLLIVNKLDLLPKNYNEEKIEKLYASCLKDFKGTCLLTHKNDLHFNALFFEILSEYKHQNIVFVGRANVGKSTLINKIIDENSLTTSIYPGTTVSFNKFIYSGYTFIDTPGLIDDDSFLTNVDNKMIKKLLPLKTIKPSVFQVYSKQAYLIEGLVEILVSHKKEASITFLINNNLDIHRTKLENSDSYLNKNIDKMSLKLLPFKDNYYDARQRLFYLRGLGLIIVKGKCRINIRVNKKIKIYEKKVVI